jgi:ketosteroid isomerase-like protein
MLAVTAAALSALAGCAATDAERPDPTEIVSQYLDAIASGDAATARSLDDDAVAAANEPDATETAPDLETLRSDAVLQAADRITDVVVDSDTSSDPGVDDGRRVSFHYSLDGETVESSLGVAWSAEGDEWELTESLAQRVWVSAAVNSVEQAWIGFSLPGATVTQPADADEAVPYFLAYPGTYQVTADLDETLLADPAAGLTQSAPVGPEAEVVVEFAVTRLP